MNMNNPNDPAAAAIPHEVIDMRDEIAAAIQGNFMEMQGYSAAPDYQGADNVQGVAVGLGDTDSGATPGAPVVTVYLAESAPRDAVRAVVVDAMQVRSAGDMPMQVVTSGVMDALANTNHVRPAPGGFSVGSFRLAGAGTLGCLVQDGAGDVMCLSNNHVLANNNNAQKGDCITQPARGDGGNCPQTKIAELEKAVEIKFDGTANDVDCAVGRCIKGLVDPRIAYNRNDLVEDRVYLRISDDTIAPALTMPVEKSGRTTGHTQGIVTGIHWYGIVNYGGQGAFFRDQVVVSGLEGRAFAEPGDSGSCIWKFGDNKPVGLLFAGGGGYTLANPMSKVLSELNVSLFTGV